MRYAALLFVVLTCFVACNPIPVAQTEIIEFTATLDYYVGTDIHVENSEIKPDREIEVYYYDTVRGLWGFVIDVFIFVGDGLIVIEDDTSDYLNADIRIIVSWFDEGPQ